MSVSEMRPVAKRSLAEIRNDISAWLDLHPMRNASIIVLSLGVAPVIVVLCYCWH